MKYTIMGFRQEMLVELGLDTMDATILRYFIDFKESKGMKVKIVDGQAYYWIRYDGVLRELPILNMKKCTVQSRFFKLRDAGVLTHQVIREGGTYSYFGIGEKYIELITSSVNVETENIEDERVEDERVEDENINHERVEDENVNHGRSNKVTVSSENLNYESSNKIKVTSENLKPHNKLKSVDGNKDSVDENSYSGDGNLKGMDGNLKGMDGNLKGYQCESTTNNSSTKDSSIKYNNNLAFLKKGAFEIINYLNLQTGKKFKSDTKVTLSLIKAKFQEGFTVEDFKTVIDNMKARWTGTKFQEYLAPTTLFGSKFETYLNKGKEVGWNGLKRGNVSRDNGEDREEALKEKLMKAILLEDM
ncbi:MAG: conserved phage C-terminal domain-containing protein [Clostridium sp.]|uniref:conserved phage C-terminal domain-containing protein n=1 Tax=Clostridium sp. TaxID=1506 RepID=UPI00305720D6